MSEASRNWDFTRLAFMDIVIMQIAIAEIMTFPNIPVSVSINEYVELAKLYSTRKSGGYINGMLDAIARHLISTNRLAKFMEPKETKEPKVPKQPKEPKQPKQRTAPRARIGKQATAPQQQQKEEQKEKQKS